MKKLLCIGLLFCLSLSSWSQKKPLDHTVYDGWQSIGERVISDNGRYVVYTVNLQEGDGWLVIRSADTAYKREIPRGYHPTITNDNRFVICLIKPLFKDTREAKIRKKKPEEMPKDSLALIDLTRDTMFKVANIKSYKTPEKGSGWLAYLAEKTTPPSAKSKPDSIGQLNNVARLADSLAHAADSLRNKIEEAKTKGLQVLQPPKKDNKKPVEETVEEGTVLTLKDLHNGETRNFNLVNDYAFSKKGNRLVIGTTRKNNDTTSRAYVLWLDPAQHAPDTVMRNPHAARNFAMDEEAKQLAFVAERDSAAKSLQKFYRLWYYTAGMDSARMIADRNTAGVSKGFTVSEYFNLYFSKSGKRLFLGLAPIRPIKDTTVPDFEKAGLDIWNYKDDDLQPVQLKNLDRDLKKSYLALWEPANNRVLALGDEKFPDILVTREGDGDVFYAGTDYGRRVARQWQGYTISDIYAINAYTGEKKMVLKGFKGSLYPSYTGRYLLLYSDRQKSYSVFNSGSGTLNRVAADAGVPFYDEENDVPDDPAPYGIAGWEKDDKHVYIYDRYAIWRIDPEIKEKSIPLYTPFARMSRISYRYIRQEHDEFYIDTARRAVFRIFYEKSKQSAYMRGTFSVLHQAGFIAGVGPYACNGMIKADSAEAYLYTRENFSSSPDLYIATDTSRLLQQGEKTTSSSLHPGGLSSIQLSRINPQQSAYLWGSAELFTWKAYTGKLTEAVLYKPAQFDSAKKYPMIVYYYERNNNTLYNYQAPSPTPSRLNISFFVSRGYVVFVPDIWYINGYPGKSAFDYIVSGTRALIKKGFIDSTKIGLQGQSWGGYQTAYVITQTHLFAAAWAGAPVVNMYSAYGGIRWESGLNRQFQYEKTQSRIGASIWERPDLYRENSPLFYLPNVQTPLVIMSNDADGAVPWYQGIEFFTAMRRLNKKIWLLEYNGEAHNLVERRNRKDIQIREQQFFDWLLKGATPPKWITDGVPATLKGIDWGLKTDQKDDVK
ncbi:MAG TPA: prolyl oligopeptidase family serine peptidase [Puia sp.]|nr:prolyl oligopeptidase family serine peptidase [Puia sp.]